MMKKFSMFLLVFALMFVVMPTTVHAGDSGTLGSLTWEFNGATDTLTIEGTSSVSEIPYFEYAMNYPWDPYRYEITTLNMINVSGVGENAFTGYEELTTVNVSGTMKKTGYGAFANCPKLTTVKLSASLNTIEAEAFANCKNLTGLTLPESLTLIGSEAFKGCEKLTKVTIPGNVKTLADSVFEGCTGLTEVNIEAKLTEIDNGVFRGCTKLKNIYIPDTVKTIGEDAFSGCAALTGISIPDGVVTIYDNAFGNCKNLKKVYIPKGVKTLDNGPFGGYYDKVKEKACFVEGFTIYGIAGTKAEKYAKTCGFKFVNHPEHTWNSGKVLKSSTCTSKGEMLYTCTACGHQKKEVTPLHTYNIYDQCTVCGKYPSYISTSVPKMTIRSISRSKTFIKVKWKKNSKVKGYEIRYSTKADMSGAKKTTISKYKTTSKKISKLKRKTTYYVQIRAYKTIGGKKMYSPWSAQKTVKTK